MTQAPRARPTLAVFDFDGTLTRRDTSLAFLAFAVGRRRLAGALVRGAPLFFADLRSVLGRGAAYERWEIEVHIRLLRALVGGSARARVRDLGRRFATGAMGAMVAPAALEQVAWHRAQGHRCALVTASLDCYAEPWGWRAGFHDVVASRLAHDDRGTIQSGFHGGACWGETKLARLREVVGPLDRYTVVVYGNGAGDRPLLARADHPVRVRTRVRWQRLAAGVREALHAA